MKTAQQMFDEAFASGSGRDPRSDEYKAGALAALQNRTGEDIRPLSRRCPYPLGTAQADAWYSGVGSGLFVYREHWARA